MKAHKGHILYSKNKDEIVSVEDGYLLEENGWIKGVFPVLPEEYRGIGVRDWGRHLIIPGFSDMHTHASQFLQRGIGMDKELLSWLDTYTFPGEARFADEEHAKKVYSQFAEELLRQGTLHVNCFGTIHMPASHILYETLREKGIFAFCGKLNMDQNSPGFYIEETASSIADTEKFLKEHPADGQMTPAIVPRFTVTCGEELLKGLGELARRYDTVIHSHMCEAVNEMKVVQELFPHYKNGADIFFKNGLLGQRPTIMAHCIFMDEDVLELMKNPNCMAVHCPDATSNINAGGIMPVKKLLDMGIALGIGSDIGSGARMSIAHGMAVTIQHSKIRNMFDPEWEAVTLPEAFYMATKSGGRFFDRVGTFEPGYRFNALVIADEQGEALSLMPLERLERFCYLGDDRNIIMRCIMGKEV